MNIPLTADAQLKKIERYVHALFTKDATGHDFFHMRRVAQLAKHIALDEQVETFVCEAAGWLHDVGDHKLFNNPKVVRHDLNQFLQTIQIDTQTIQTIEFAMCDVSFSKGNIPKTIEGKIVQDADRLDAIGAIGIARAFAYGGAHDQRIYSDINREQTSIQHFYDKLLHLTHTLHTKTAQTIAKDRHLFMEAYLEQFLKEWQAL